MPKIFKVIFFLLRENKNGTFLRAFWANVPEFYFSS
jgi:hypothetical protein